MTINFTTWHDKNAATHLKETNKAWDQGFRTVSLCVYGERSDPRYAAVMVKRADVHPETQFHDLNASQFQKTVKDMAAKGFKPYTVSATGPADNPLIAVSFRPLPQSSIAQAGIKESELLKLNLEKWRNNWIPVSIDAYGTPGDVRYVAIWHPNTERNAWNLDAVSDAVDLATYQQRFNAITIQGGRPTFVVKTPDNKYLGMFVDNAVSKWESRGELTSAKLQGYIDKWKKIGGAPLWVTAQGTGANALFSATFADGEEPIKRVFKPSDTAISTAPIDEIDNTMKKFMEDHSMRGCALAIVKDTRLVYAKGYTYAEPGYTEPDPRTFFRMASCSKLFTAAAIYRLIQQGTLTPDGKPFTLETTMQSVLKLKTPDNKDPVSPKFKDITIRHLLESISGIDQSAIMRDFDVAAIFKSTGACTPDQMASYCASLPLKDNKTPGDTTNVVYGNTDYFLLSQVVAKMCGKAKFEQALQKLILDPLKISRIRESRSFLSKQEAGEARYHTVNINPEPYLDENGKPNGVYTDYPASLWVGNSLTGGALVPHEYGTYNYELYDGTGGLSGAVTDVARLVAAMSLHQNNPVFSVKTLETWFTNVVKTQTFTGPKRSGFHGFDNLSLLDPNKPVMETANFGAWKGGWIPSGSGMIIFRSGFYSFVVLSNSIGQADVKTDWFIDPKGDGFGTPNNLKWDPESIGAITVARDWGTIDLFPKFGMPSFSASKSAVAPPKDPSLILKSLANISQFVARNRSIVTLQPDTRENLIFRAKK